MLEEVKKCIDRDDIQGLRYIFADALDVDPTFERYREDYNYCKGINNFFEANVEKTPLRQESSRWDRQYYEQLKIELMKNFSEVRFEHMIKVAKVVYADKAARLLSERQKREQQNINKPDIKPSTLEKNINMSQSALHNEELQEKKLAEMRKQLEHENQEAERKIKEQKALVEAKKRQNINVNKTNSNNTADNSLKKVVGAVLAVIVLVVIILLISRL